MKRVIAREWLYLVIGFFVGIIIIPPFFYLFISPESYTSTLSLSKAYVEIIKTLFGSEGFGSALLALIIILIPYWLFQFVRSIMWATKTVKGK